MRCPIKIVEGQVGLIICNLHDLKVKLGCLVMYGTLSATLLEHVAEWKDPQGTLYFGAAIAFVSAVLDAFDYFGEKD